MKIDEIMRAPYGGVFLEELILAKRIKGFSGKTLKSLSKTHHNNPRSSYELFQKYPRLREGQGTLQFTAAFQSLVDFFSFFH